VSVSTGAAPGLLLKHEAKNLNKNSVVAPTGFGPVSGHGHAFARILKPFDAASSVTPRHD